MKYPYKAFDNYYLSIYDENQDYFAPLASTKERDEQTAVSILKGYAMDNGTGRYRINGPDHLSRYLVEEFTI